MACGVSRDGSKASNMVKAARSYGLVPRAFRKEPADLPDLDLPLIVFWNFNHFLVVDGFSKSRDKVYLNDPAMGPRTVTMEEFDRSFTGIVIAFDVGPDFKKGGQVPSIWTGLASRLGGSESALAFAILVGLCLTIPGLVVPTFSRTLHRQSPDRGPGRLAGALVAGHGRHARSADNSQLAPAVLPLPHVAEAVHHGLGPVLLARAAPAKFNLRFAGNLAGRASVNGNIAELLSGQLASSGLAVITILFYAVVMLQYIVPLTLLGIAFAAVNLVALRAISRKRVDASHRLAQETGKLVSTSYSGLQMIETLKATGTDSDFPARWAGYQAKALNAQEELAVYTAFLMGMPTLLAATSTAVVLSIGGERVIAGSLSIGSLIAFQALMVSFSTPVTGLVNLAGSAQEAAADMSRLDDVLRHPLDSSVQAYARPEAGQEARRLEGELELRDLTFGYSRR